VPILVAEGGGETLNIRAKPLGASTREVGHTPMLTAYPTEPPSFFDTVVLEGYGETFGMKRRV
jgi:hypothetical protein